MVRGFTLADVPGRVTWRAVLAMIHRARYGSAVYHEVHGEAGRWSNHEHIDVSILETLQQLLWIQSDTKKTPRPKPIVRPGVEPESETLTFGGKESAVPESEFWAIWNATPEDPTVEPE